MKITSRHLCIFIVMILWIFSLMKLSGDAKNEFEKPQHNVKIFWEAAYLEKGLTIIPGSVQINSGLFHFGWIVNKDGTVKLVTYETPGAGEMPPKETGLLILVKQDGTTLIFQRWFPQLNTNEPNKIRPIVSVLTNELFSVLPRIKLPPNATVSSKIQTIKWEREFSKKESLYLPGSIKASFGTLNMYWKKVNNGTPELITIESPGAGELSSIESRLELWMDGSSNSTIILQERNPQLNQEITSYLWPLAKVKSNELMSGFKKISYLKISKENRNQMRILKEEK